jgi:hypothetical protein
MPFDALPLPREQPGERIVLVPVRASALKELIVHAYFDRDLDHREAAALDRAL